MILVSIWPLSCQFRHRGAGAADLQLQFSAYMERSLQVEMALNLSVGGLVLLHK